MDGSAGKQALERMRSLAETFGESTAKQLEKLQGELDAMIAASQKPGYSGESPEALHRKKDLVTKAIKTGLLSVAESLLANETRNETSADVEPVTHSRAETQSTSETTKSTFVPANETAEPTTKTQERATGTRFERLMSGTRSMASSGYDNVGKFFSWAGKGISDFLTYAGTSISALWNRLFGKKDNNVPVEATVKPTEPTPEAQNDATRGYEENPPPSDQPTPSSPSDVTPSPSPEENNRTPKPEPTAPSTTPPTEAEATPSPEVAAVNIMDGKEHAIAGHNIVWTGNADNLLSINGKVFGVTLLTMGKIMAGNPTLEKRGDTLVIRAAGRTVELTKAQTSSLFSQALNGTRTTNFFPRYDYVSVNLEYSTVTGDGASATRTPGSMVIELLPK